MRDTGVSSREDERRDRRAEDSALADTHSVDLRIVSEAESATDDVADRDEPETWSR